VLAALGFAAAAAAIRLLLPDPLYLYAPPRSEKLALLARDREATVAAFGTSRVHNGFLPSAFDTAFAGAPYAVHSLNLALFGGSQTEQRALAREFLARLSPGGTEPAFCIAILELNAGLNFELVNLFHPRSVNLYDLDTVLFAASFSDASVGRVREIARAGVALVAGLLHYSGLGMLSEALFQRPRGGGAEAERGFVNEPRDEAGRRGVEAAFRDRPQTPVVATMSILPGNRALVAELRAAAARRNVHFFYLVSPSLDDLYRYPEYPAAIEVSGTPVPILNLARPDRYPQLFRPELWRDPGHLDTEGAALFSRILAEEVKARLGPLPAAACGE